jgi:hypothetical protein
VEGLFVLRPVAPQLRLGLQSQGSPQKDSLLLLIKENIIQFLKIMKKITSALITDVISTTLTELPQQQSHWITLLPYFSASIHKPSSAHKHVTVTPIKQEIHFYLSIIRLSRLSNSCFRICHSRQDLRWTSTQKPLSRFRRGITIYCITLAHMHPRVTVVP